MRITNNMMNNSLMYSIQNNLNRMDGNLKHIHSGKLVNKPSDNPVATARILGFNQDLSEFEQYDKNVRDAISQLEITETSLDEIGSILHRARELSVQAANDGALSPDDEQKIGAELKALTEHLISSGNFNFAGKYVFSGLNTDEKLLEKDGSYNLNLKMSNDPVGDPTQFLDNPAKADRLELLIGTRETIAYSTHGVQVFGPKKSYTLNQLDANGKPILDASGNPQTTTIDLPELVGDMRELAESLLRGESDKASQFLSKADGHLERVLAERADIGARVNRLELVKNRLASNTQSFTGMLSEAQDTDMAEEIMLLKNAENVYRASLSTGAKVLQPTLVDFLR